MAKEFVNDKVVSEMTRDGLQEHNLNTGEIERVSNRFENYSFNSSNGQLPNGSLSSGAARNSHSHLQRKYNRKFQHNLQRKKHDSAQQEKLGTRIQKKEAHMRKKTHLRLEQVRKIDYEAYGKLGRPKDYTGEEHCRYGKRLQRTPKLYRTRDLAVTRMVRGGGRALFRRAESLYFTDDENNNAQRFLHDGYRTFKHGSRYAYRKLSHPVNKFKNKSYLDTKDKLKRADRRERRHEKRTDKYRFKLSMESAWRKELRADEAMRQLNAREKLKKKIIFKHAYKKRYEQTFVQKVKNYFIKAAKKTKQYIAGKVKMFLTAGCILVLVGCLFYMLTSCGTMLATFGTEGAAQMIAGLFVTGFDEISSCDEYFSKLLNDLQNDILDIEKNNPGYDEYQYWVNGTQVKDADAMNGFITYEQMHLASYLSTKIPEYTLETATPLMDELFTKMFVLEQEEVIEERERQARDADGAPKFDADGSPVMELYDCHIWKTSLTVRTIDEIMQEELTEDEYSQFDTFCRSECNLKIYNSPFAFEWHQYISSPFGYRNHPIYGVGKMHAGVDIAVPAGTKVYSVMEGTVTTSAYSESAGNWIVIKDKDGYVSKYMHCSTLLVGAGTQVRKGQLIATVGSTGHSTGNHLHLQIETPDGQYINPLYICAEYGEEVSNGNE